MKIYNYNPVTGEYVGQSDADESPMEPGVFLIPACATKLEPPAAGSKQAAVFQGGEWVIQPDWRGTVGYDNNGGQVVISNIGDTLESLGLTAEPPEEAPAPPTSCTRRQGRLALLANGLLADVEALIAAIPDATQRQAAQIEYEADTWERSNATLQAMWAQLDGTPEGLDDLFALAVTL